MGRGYFMEISDNLKSDTLEEKKIPDFDARREKEVKNMRKLFARVTDPRKKKLIFRIIDEAAFQIVIMEEARAAIVEKGLSCVTVNASQKFVKEVPELETYNKFQKMYTANVNSLIGYLPPEEQKKAAGLMKMRSAAR